MAVGLATLHIGVLLLNVAYALKIAVLDAKNGTNEVLPRAVLFNVCNCPNAESLQ